MHGRGIDAKNAPCREADPWIALSYFDLLAEANGLGTCWSGFAVRAFKGMRGVRKALNLPRGYEVGAVLLFGIPDVAYARVPHPRPMSVDVQQYVEGIYHVRMDGEGPFVELRF